MQHLHKAWRFMTPCTYHRHHHHPHAAVGFLFLPPISFRCIGRCWLNVNKMNGLIRTLLFKNSSLSLSFQFFFFSRLLLLCYLVRLCCSSYSITFFSAVPFNIWNFCIWGTSGSKFAAHTKEDTQNLQIKISKWGPQKQKKC